MDSALEGGKPGLVSPGSLSGCAGPLSGMLGAEVRRSGSEEYHSVESAGSSEGEGAEAGVARPAGGSAPRGGRRPERGSEEASDRMRAVKESAGRTVGSAVDRGQGAEGEGPGGGRGADRQARGWPVAGEEAGLGLCGPSLRLPKIGAGSVGDAGPSARSPLAVAHASAHSPGARTGGCAGGGKRRRMAEPRVAASQSETDSDPGYPLSTPSSGEFERSPDPLAVLSQPNAKAAGGGLWSSYRDAAERQCREEAGEDADEVNVAEDVFYASGAPQPVQGAVRGGAGASGHIAIPAPVAISGPTPSTSRLAGPGRGTRAPSPVDDRGRSPGQCGAERGVGSTGVGGGCRGAEAGPGGSPRVSGEPWGSVGREVGGTGARTPRESRSRAETRDVIMDSASMFERPSRGNWLEQDVVGGEAPGTGESAGERGARTSPGTAVEVELAVGGNRRSARRTWSPLRSRASSEREPTRVRSGPLPPAGPSDLCGSIALELEARSLSCGVLAAMDAEDADGSLPLTPREAAVRHAANMNRLSSSTPTPSVNSSAEHPRYLPSAGSALRMGVAGDPGWASSSTDRPIVARGVARQDGGHRPPARMAPRSSRGHAAGRDSRDHGVRCRARHHKAVSALCLDVLTETRSSWGSEGLDPRDPPRDMDPSCAARQAGYSYNFVPAPPPSDLSRPSSAPLSTMGEILIPAPSAEETGTGSYPGEDDDSSNGDGSWGISARTDVPPNGAASTMSISERYSGRLLCGRSPSWDRSSADRDVGDGRTSIDLYSDLRDSVSVRRRASFDVPGDRRDSVNRRSRHRETSCELETNPNLKMSGSGALARGSGPAVVSRVVTHMRRRSMEMLRRLCWRECDKPEAL